VHLLLVAPANASGSVEKLSTTSIAGTLVTLSGVLMLMAAFASLGSKLFNRYVAYYAFQSIVLSFACAVVAFHFHSGELWALAFITLAVKGIAIPMATRRLLLRRMDLKRDVALTTGLSTSLIIGALLTGFAFLVIQPQALPHGVIAASAVPLSTALVLLGALSMVVRRHIVAQLIGWLITENGVFLGAITLVATFPFIVEAGIFLDLVAAVLIMIVFVSGITRRLGEATASELRELRG
jgi:hydrogenase-4 component E